MLRCYRKSCAVLHVFRNLEPRWFVLCRKDHMRQRLEGGLGTKQAPKDHNSKQSLSCRHQSLFRFPDSCHHHVCIKPTNSAQTLVFHHCMKKLPHSQETSGNCRDTAVLGLVHMRRATPERPLHGVHSCLVEVSCLDQKRILSEDVFVLSFA